VSGERAEWSKQISHSLAQLEARTARLDTHSGELARELLDVIGRLDRLVMRVVEVEGLAQRLVTVEAQLEALDASFVRHQQSNENELDRLQRVIEKVDQNLDRHQDAHWRSGR
jgi:chromosome segregation ATPase